MSHSGGFKSIKSSFKFLRKEKAFKRGWKALKRMNQPEKGIDCPGCAWPDPEKTSAYEYCENGVKAIAAETTIKTADPDLFEKYSIDELRMQSGYWLEQQGRLSHPMYKPKGATHYEPIEWSKAFDLIAEHLKKCGSPNEAVFYTSGRTSNEAAFMYQLMGRSFGTNNFPDCSNLCHESSGVALKESIGIGKGTVKLEDFDKADCIFVVGHNTATNHPRMLTELQKAGKRGAEIVVINPLKEKGLMSFVHPQDIKAVLFGKATNICSTYVQVRAGGDYALFSGILKSFFEQGGAVDQDFITNETTGFDLMQSGLQEISWDYIVNEAGVEKEEIEKLASIYINADRTIICWAMGITQHTYAVPTIQQMVNLLLVKGNIGKEGAGACPVRGHSNVQGDRTMGIHEKPPKVFLDKLQEVFAFEPPREHGYDFVSAVKAMHLGKVKILMSMGGNFVAAAPDTDFVGEAISNLELTVHVSTKLNMSHVVTGKEALILPCLGRTDIDLQNGKPQRVSVEDSMSMVHGTEGALHPISEHLLSEPRIVAEIGKRISPTIEWDAMASDYSIVREKIAQVVGGFSDYNEKIKNKGGFFLGNSAADHKWNTESGKAEFNSPEELYVGNHKNALRLLTIRSHDQYNTTVYGMNDRYRGVSNERMVVFMNTSDMIEMGFQEGQKVKLTSAMGDRTREVSGFKVKSYDIKKGCVGAYFPETNPLIAIDSVALKSNTPVSKLVPVFLERL